MVNNVLLLLILTIISIKLTLIKATKCKLNELVIQATYIPLNRPLFNLSTYYDNNYSIQLKSSSNEDNLDDFNEYFQIDLNSNIYQINYLKRNYFKYELILFNATYDQLNDKNRFLNYESCEFVLKIELNETFNEKNKNDSSIIIKDLIINEDTKENTIIFNYTKISSLNYTIEYCISSIDSFNFDEYFKILSNGSLILTKQLKIDNYLNRICRLIKTYQTLIILNIQFNHLNKYSPLIITKSPINYYFNLNLSSDTYVCQIQTRDIDVNSYNNRLNRLELIDFNGNFNEYFELNTANGLINANLAKIKQDFNEFQNISFKFTIVAYDNGSPQLNTTKDFELNLIISNDTTFKLNRPMFIRNNLNYSINENSPLNSQIFNLNENDLVRSINNDYKYHLINPFNDTFNVKKENGNIKLILNNDIDYENQANYTLFLYLTNLNETLFYDTCILTINIIDLNDNYPIFYLNNSLIDNHTYEYNIELYELISIGYDLSLECVDLDTQSVLEYSLVNDYNGSFEINSRNGLFKVLKPLDYDHQQTYGLLVLVDDGLHKIKIHLNILLIQVPNNKRPKFQVESELIKLNLNEDFNDQNEAYLTSIHTENSSTIEFLNKTNEWLIDCSHYSKAYILIRLVNDTKLYAKLWKTHSNECSGPSLSLTISQNIYLKLNAYKFNSYTSEYLTTLKIISIQLNGLINKLKSLNETNLIYLNEQNYPLNKITINENIPINSCIYSIKLFKLNETFVNNDYLIVRIISGNFDNSFRLELINKTFINLITNRLLDSEIRDLYRLKLTLFYQQSSSATLINEFIYINIRIQDINDNLPIFINTFINLNLTNENIRLNSPIFKVPKPYDIDSFSLIQYSILNEHYGFEIDKYSGLIVYNRDTFLESDSLNLTIVASDGKYLTKLIIHINLTDHQRFSIINEYEWILCLNDPNRRQVQFNQIASIRLISNEDLFQYNGSVLAVNDRMANTTSFNYLYTLIQFNDGSYSIVYLINNCSISNELKLNYEFIVDNDNESTQLGTSIGTIYLSNRLIEFSNITCPFRLDYDSGSIFQVDYLNKTLVNYYIYQIRLDDNSTISIKITTRSYHKLFINQLSIHIKLNSSDTCIYKVYSTELVQFIGNDYFMFNPTLNCIQINFNEFIGNIRLMDNLAMNENIQLNDEFGLISYNKTTLSQIELINVDYNIDMKLIQTYFSSRNYIDIIEKTNFVLNEYMINLDENKISNFCCFILYPRNIINLIDITIEYQIDDSYQNLFLINSSSGQLTNRIKFDYESDYDIKILKNNIRIMAILRDKQFRILRNLTSYFKVILNDVDEYEAYLGDNQSETTVYANLSLNEVIFKLNAIDYDKGLQGRVFYSIDFIRGNSILSNLFSLNKLNGELRLANSLNSYFIGAEFNNDEFSYLIDKYLLIIKFNIKLNNVSPTHQFKLIVNYSCFNCTYPISSNNEQNQVKDESSFLESFVNSIWPIVLICLLGLTLIILLGLIIAYLFCKNRRKKVNKGSNKSDLSLTTSTLTNTSIESSTITASTATYNNNNINNKSSIKLNTQPNYHDYLINLGINSNNNDISYNLYDVNNKQIPTINVIDDNNGINDEDDDELSIQKWDNLLDWTPQYANLLNVFNDLNQLDS